MAGTDIGFEIDHAVRELKKAVDDRIDGLRQEAERIEERMRLAASAREQQVPVEMRAELGAKPARVLVFEWPGEGRGRVEHIELTSWGTLLGEARLLQPLEEGKSFRAFLVIVPA
jgi:hypothetical protein